VGRSLGGHNGARPTWKIPDLRAPTLGPRHTRWQPRRLTVFQRVVSRVLASESNGPPHAATFEDSHSRTRGQAAFSKGHQNPGLCVCQHCHVGLLLDRMSSSLILALAGMRDRSARRSGRTLSGDASRTKSTRG
jgi:hypothetical protein